MPCSLTSPLSNRLVGNHFYPVTDGSLGIYFVDVENTIVAHNFFIGDGAHCSWKNAGLGIDSSFSVKVTDNEFRGLNYSGVVLDNNTRPFSSRSVFVSNNLFEYVGIGFEIDGMVSVGAKNACEAIYIIGNQGYSCHNIAHVGVLGSNIANNVVIENNYLDIGYKGFRLYGNNYNVILRHNIMLNLTSTPSLETGTLIAEGNVGYRTSNSLLSGPFAVDSVGCNSVTVSHGLDYVPLAQDVQATIVEETDVDDYCAFITKVKDITSTQLTVDIYVQTASATFGATAKVSVRIENV